MGMNLAPSVVIFLLMLAADTSIAGARVRPIGVDVSITRGILMFIWG